MAKKLSLGEKVTELDPDFAKEVVTLTVEQLKEKIVTLTKYSCELEEAKSLDGDLQEKQAQAREAAKSYSEPLTANRLKRRLIVQILKEKNESA